MMVFQVMVNNFIGSAPLNPDSDGDGLLDGADEFDP